MNSFACLLKLTTTAILVSGGLALTCCGQSSIEDWRSMESVPRDGTIIEVRNTYGVAPWYSLYQWTSERSVWHKNNFFPNTLIKVHGKPGWEDVTNKPKGGLLEDSKFNMWRPYYGSPTSYVDPTGGAQDTDAYWMKAAAKQKGLPEDYFLPKPWWRRWLCPQ